jgi:hypothetical protein
VAQTKSTKQETESKTLDDDSDQELGDNNVRKKSSDTKSLATGFIEMNCQIPRVLEKPMTSSGTLSNDEFVNSREQDKTEQFTVEKQPNNSLDDYFLDSDDEVDAYTTDLLSQASKMLEEEDLKSIVKSPQDCSIETTTRGEPKKNAEPVKAEMKIDKPSTRRTRKRPNNDNAPSTRIKAAKRTRQKTGAKKKQPNPPTYQVESIIDSKVNRQGLTLYKARWLGFGPADDTWEPLCNVAQTGHVDYYERRKRAEKITADSPGAAIIEYEDGERTLVDLSQETFRRSAGEFLDSSNDDSLNDFNIVYPGAKLELFWPYVDMFFVCNVVSWTPLQEIASVGSLEVPLYKPTSKEHKVSIEENSTVMTLNQNGVSNTNTTCEQASTLATSKERSNSPKILQRSESSIKAAKLLQNIGCNPYNSSDPRADEATNTPAIEQMQLAINVSCSKILQRTESSIKAAEILQNIGFNPHSAQDQTATDAVPTAAAQNRATLPSEGLGIPSTEGSEKTDSTEQSPDGTKVAYILQAFKHPPTTFVTEEDFCGMSPSQTSAYENEDATQPMNYEGRRRESILAASVLGNLKTGDGDVA